MPLGLRDKSEEPREPFLRRTNMLQQISRNGQLIISDNSDRSYKQLLARDLGLLGDASWGEIVAAFSGRKRRDVSRRLARAAARWCDEMSVLAEIWTDALTYSPIAVIGYNEVMPLLLSRIERTHRLLAGWRLLND